MHHTTEIPTAQLAIRSAQLQRQGTFTRPKQIRYAQIKIISLPSAIWLELYNKGMINRPCLQEGWRDYSLTQS